jgi:hypothetical protein
MNDHSEIPDDFPPNVASAVVPGAQAKVCVVLCCGQYIAGQTDAARYAHWLLCEDLAQQLVAVARRDSAKHPENSMDYTLERVRTSVGRMGWISPDELSWLMRRLHALLG